MSDQTLEPKVFTYHDLPRVLRERVGNARIRVVAPLEALLTEKDEIPIIYDPGAKQLLTCERFTVFFSIIFPVGFLMVFEGVKRRNRGRKRVYRTAYIFPPELTGFVAQMERVKSVGFTPDGRKAKVFDLTQGTEALRTGVSIFSLFIQQYGKEVQDTALNFLARAFMREEWLKDYLVRRASQYIPISVTHADNRGGDGTDVDYIL